MIHLDNVAKEYRGWLGTARKNRVHALDGVSLHVPPGTVMGVVGPNGAGKSTLIKLLLGYLRPTRGTVRIGGMEPRAWAQSRGVAYVPELPTIPESWTVGFAMRYFASLGELDDPAPKIGAALKRVGMDGTEGRKIRELSKGMLQRVAIGQALLGEREVMVLDEPTSGLDPEWVAELRAIVAEWRAASPGRVALISSHDLNELERTADRVAVLVAGQVREVIDLRAAEARFPAYRIVVDSTPHAAQAVLACFPDAVAEEGSPLSFRVQPADVEDLDRRVAALLARGVALRALAPERETLEQRFREVRKRGKGRP
ncbi:ABC transporter ATP-binding protein [Longimicrobium sp.]|uniref:ABC transporter ATP-binding protein n=1 Tax=Longimicrobium sp. TaxID=2029185 RepID=UPI002C7E0C9E|nr:ABC transporter ATP-binding protein [Longimicrobium sp.]HSU14254.1 ABC transporter ATP-binding protein [Longimicrobium sp.]